MVVKEKKVKYLKKSSGTSTKRMTRKQTVELCTDINKCKITNWKERSKNRANWEKSINLLAPEFYI
jgi:Cdc6-like AAA superfamily ATPase